MIIEKPKKVNYLSKVGPIHFTDWEITQLTNADHIQTGLSNSTHVPVWAGSPKVEPAWSDAI
jgi:hypothetical protein